MNSRFGLRSTLAALVLTSLLGCSAENAPARGLDGSGGNAAGQSGVGGGATFAGSGGSPGFPQAGSPSTFGGSPTSPGSAGSMGTAGAGMVPTSCVPGSTKARSGVIDDLEDGNNAIALKAPFQGYWYVYNDGTGTQTPARDVPAGSSPFMGKAGGATTPAYAACTSGSGFTLWGAGIGFNLQDIGGSACGVDASSVSGIRFQAKGSGTVRLQIASGPTATPANGGTCSAAMGCDFHANAAIPLSASWTAQSFTWAQLMPGVAAIDPTTLLGVQFQASGTGTIPPFDFCIDDVEFF